MLRNMISYGQILLGSLVLAVAINLFMVPNHLPSGGLGGLMLILHYQYGIPVGSIYFVANLPILFGLYRLFGLDGLFKTVAGITFFSALLETTKGLADHAPTHNPLLATLYAGVMMGLGLGLVMRAGGSTGGTSSIAQVVQHHTGMDMAKFLVLTDLLILMYGAATLSPELVLYGLITTYLVGRTVHFILDGLQTAHAIMVISEHPDAVAQVMMNEIKRGVTRLDGTGEYTRLPRPVLLCVVSEREVVRIKRLILEADPEAFMLVTEAREVSGRGFTLDTEVRRVPFWVS